LSEGEYNHLTPKNARSRSAICDEPNPSPDSLDSECFPGNANRHGIAQQELAAQKTAASRRGGLR
jgi:hypothetical protein